MTEQEIQEAGEKYATTVHWGIPKADWIAGAKWMQQQIQEELKEANRNKDMCWMAYKSVKEELTNKDK